MSQTMPRQRSQPHGNQRLAPRLSALLGVALLLAGACSHAPSMAGQPATTTTAPGTTSDGASGPPATIEPAPRAATDPVRPDGQTAKEHVRALAEQIGPRVAGTPGEAAARQYIQDRLTAWGYHVAVESFSFPDWFQRGMVQLDDQQITAWPMVGSARGAVSGEAVDVGPARPQDVASRDLQGKVAVARRGDIPFGEKLANVQAEGAAALVVVNSRPEALMGNLGREADIPAVGVRGDDGSPLQAAALAGQVVTVEAPGGAASQSANVLASPGPEARCKVLVGAHHDTVPGAPGANDNASGTATVLELARAFAADGLDDGLCFATFGAEESGLHGSRALADRLKAEGTLPEAMVNLDVTGSGREVEVIGSDHLVALATGLAAQHGIPAREGQLPPSSSSDHASFQGVGVPVVFFTSGEFNAIHTPEDTVDGVEPEELARVGELAAVTIEALLLDPSPR